ncbi:unnamed protein product [Diatraea saccharalis]|uniref:Uncharacterized protein n=1 Tax=Diatraea saccharalis TaxID=40085 RepID=A0A9N9WIM2_9NEOP|nr:unnamed protein product [Diatraea saccharalis]
MPLLKIPHDLTLTIDGHNKWLKIIKDAQELIDNDIDMQVYERRIKMRSRLNKIFMEELKKERIRLIVFKKEDQIDDITEEIREWFKEWYYGYGFFPEFPYDLEGGTLIVVRGDYPSVEQKKEADEKYLAATKGKTKDQVPFNSPLSNINTS